jgi:hypothetical protein
MIAEIQQKLSDAIVAAAEYPAALEQLRAAWAELLNTLHMLGIPLPPRADWRGQGIVPLRGGGLTTPPTSARA